MKISRLLLVVLSSSLFMPVSCTLGTAPIARLVAALDTRDVSKGDTLHGTFFVAVTPGCKGEPFRLEHLSSLKDCSVRRSEVCEQNEVLTCNFKLPKPADQLQRGPYETWSYQVLEAGADTQWIKVVHGDDDYEITSSYRVTPQGLVPQSSHIWGIHTAFRALPFGLLLAFAIRWGARRWLKRLDAGNKGPPPLQKGDEGD